MAMKPRRRLSGWTLSKALSVPVNATKRNGKAVFLSWRDRSDT